MRPQLFPEASQGASNRVGRDGALPIVGAVPRVLGVDPGKSGGAVVLDGPRVAHQLRLDPIVGGKKWEAVHAEVSRWVRQVHAERPIDVAVLELHGLRPKEGIASARTTGIGWGLWLGILSALGIHVLTPASKRWTGEMLRDLPGDGKDRAIALCRAKLPDLDLTPGQCRTPQSGLADAGALALYGQRVSL